MSVIADAKGLALRIFPTDAIIYSDPKLLEQIIRNLVFNAMKYTKTGRSALRNKNKRNKTF
jgi:signal transduction histidine kinase